MPLNSTTDYGTIPTTFAAAAPGLSTFATHNRGAAAKSVSITRRPWRELFNLSSFSLPESYPEAISRIKWNLNYFRPNYVIIFLVILLLSLIYHPVSMIVFLIVFVAWYFLYFSHDGGPILIFNRLVDDKVVILGLGLVTILALVLTHVGLNVLVALSIGVVVVGLHAAFRMTDDLFLDEESVVGNALFSVVGNQGLEPTHSYTRL